MRSDAGYPVLCFFFRFRTIHQSTVKKKLDRQIPEFLTLQSRTELKDRYQLRIGEWWSNEVLQMPDQNRRDENVCDTLGNQP